MLNLYIRYNWKYGDYLKIFYSKSHIAIKIFHLALRTCVLSFWWLPEEVLQDVFHIFSGIVMAVLMSWMDSKVLPFTVILTWKNQAFHGARAGESGGWGHTMTSAGVVPLYGTQCPHSPRFWSVLYSHLQRELPELLQKVAWKTGWVCWTWGRSVLRESKHNVSLLY